MSDKLREELTRWREDYATKHDQLREALDALEEVARAWTWIEMGSRVTSAGNVECAKKALRILDRHGRFIIRRRPGIPERPQDNVWGWWPENAPKKDG